MWMRKVLQKKRKGERRKSSSITDVKLLLAGDWMEKFRPPYIYGKEGEGVELKVFPFWLVYQLLPWALSINKDSSTILFH